MSAYHIKPTWLLGSSGLALFFVVVSFLMRDLIVLCFAILLCVMAFVNLTSQVIIDQEGVSLGFKILPFSPSWRRRVKWIDVVQVRATPNPFFVEGDVLTLIAHLPCGKQQKLHIPFILYTQRQQLVKQLFDRLPSRVECPSGLVRWAETVGFTPRWQLRAALVLLLFLAGIVWWSAH